LEYECLPEDSFISVLLNKLKLVVNSVNFVTGGFLEFQLNFPELCERKTRRSCPSLPSLPQPCLSTSNNGPTRILPFLYLGSQHDAMNGELLRSHNITYELNVSTTCPKPDFIKDSHFMRIPVNDNYSEKLLPHFPKACNFLDKVRESNGCAIVHCLAGISRSATIAIAYVMRHLKMSSDEAYRYVKSKRDSISPNFNFIGELLEFERQLRCDRILESCPNESCTTSPSYTSPAVLQHCQ
ncbi:Dual specificity protein phosphatase 8-like protein, partial [Leptotrombidium deliense]